MDELRDTQYNLPVGTDCISRQAAFDALDDAEDAFGYLTRDWEEVLMELPSAQPEPLKIDLSGYSEEDWERLKKEWRNTPITVLSAQPKRGKWIKTARWGRVYYCDQCRNYLDFDGVNAGRGSTNFCPNCGADMRGEQNEP